MQSKTKSKDPNDSNNKKTRKKLTKLNTNANEFQLGEFKPQDNDFFQSLNQMISVSTNEYNEQIYYENSNEINIGVKKTSTDDDTYLIKEDHDLEKGRNKQFSSNSKKTLESEETNDSKGEDNDLESKNSSQNNQSDLILNDNINNEDQIQEQLEIYQSEEIQKKQDNTHPLSEKYVFYYQPRGKMAKNIYQQYKQNTIPIGETITSLEQFLEIYLAIKKPSEWDENHKVSLFKEGNFPLWEQYKDGGCLILMFQKNKWLDQMNSIWELLLFSVIADQLKARNKIVSENIVGIVMNIRSRDNYLEIWLKNAKLKLETALELKYFMNVHDKQPYYFTLHRKSIRAQSMNSGMEELRYSKQDDKYVSQMVVNKRSKHKW